MGADLNNVTLIGRLGRDVETPNGNGPVRFSLAVNRRVKKNDEWTEEASWIDIEYWHRSILPHLTKGKQIAVRGELKQDRWTDRDTGKERSKIMVLAQEIQLLGSREEGHGQARAGSDEDGRKARVMDAIAGRESPPRGTAPAPKTDDLFTDDIPF